MLLVRAIIAAGTLVSGAIVLVEMLRQFDAGWAILPGAVLGAAMIALGSYRLRQIAAVLRARKTT